MNGHRSGDLESLANPSYLLALLLVVTPLVDLIANVWPIRLGDVGWRYGAVGVASGYVITPLLGIALACFIGVALRQRVVLRALVGVCLAVAVVLVIASIDFVMDAMQLRHTVPATTPLARWSFDVGAAKALFKHLSGAVALVWLGLGTRRALRSISSVNGERASTPPLVARRSVPGQ